MATHREALAFGMLLAEVRSRNFKSLRDFCLKTGHDPVRVSKWERGLAPPPADSRKIEFLAKALGLQEGTESHRHFILLAREAVATYSTPEVSREDLLKKMPGAFRGLRVDEAPEDIIEDAWNVAKEAHGADEK